MTLQHAGLPYQEFRPDGWPLCPVCGEDELYSLILFAWQGEEPKPTLDDCLSGPMCCSSCQFDSRDLLRVG